MTYEMLYSVAACAASISAAASDLSTRRIPNRLTGASAMCGLAMHWLLDGLPGLGSSALAGMMMGTIFLVFYAAGAMGAGDVKLLAAIGCLSGLRPLQMILVATVFSGMLLALAIATYRKQFTRTLGNTWQLLQHHRQHGLRAHEELNVRSESALNMPFAVPVAVACLVSLGMEMVR